MHILLLINNKKSYIILSPKTACTCVLHVPLTSLLHTTHILHRCTGTILVKYLRYAYLLLMWYMMYQLQELCRAIAVMAYA